MQYHRVLTLTAVLCLTVVSSAQEEWPRYRGPRGDGHTHDRGLPLEWNEKSIVWKTPLKGQGQSSAIIWGERIFLTSALDKGKQRLVFCVDRKSGKILWEQVAWTGEPEPSHAMNGWATSTCVTDGERVYASFGKGGLHCYTVEGKHVWSRELGKFFSRTKRGTASSPIVHGDLVIWNGDSESDPFLFGLNKLTGETVWKADRPAKEGYSTPIIVDANGRQELILNGDPFVAGYDPLSGKQLWFCKSFAPRGEPSVTFADGLVYVVNGQPGDVYTVRPGGSGNVTSTHMVWHTPRKLGRDQPAPIVANGYMLVANMEGVLVCYEAKMGKELWRERMTTSKITAAPAAADGRVYWLDESGQTTVIEPGPTYKVLAQNSLGATSQEIFRATPTPYRGQFFIRSDTTLYCIGK
jgi:outer membrane protein assembly factor BamB